MTSLTDIFYFTSLLVKTSRYTVIWLCIRLTKALTVPVIEPLGIGESMISLLTLLCVSLSKRAWFALSAFLQLYGIEVLSFDRTISKILRYGKIITGQGT